MILFGKKAAIPLLFFLFIYKMYIYILFISYEIVSDVPTFVTCGEDKGPKVLFFTCSGVILVLPECTMFCFVFEASVFFFSGILPQKRCDCKNEASLLATTI